MMSGMIKVVESVGDALRTPQHNEVHADLYGCVMSCPGYTQEALM
jgi:phage baseplate assembly protein W